MATLAEETAARLRQQLAEMAVDALAVGLDTLAQLIALAQLEAAKNAGAPEVRRDPGAG